MMHLTPIISQIPPVMNVLSVIIVYHSDTKTYQQIDSGSHTKPTEFFIHDPSENDISFQYTKLNFIVMSKAPHMIYWYTVHEANIKSSFTFSTGNYVTQGSIDLWLVQCWEQPW